MTAGAGLRLLCHTAVCAWLAVLATLGLFDSRAVSAHSEPAELRAPVRPVELPPAPVEPEPAEPEPEPKPKPPTEAPASPEPEPEPDPDPEPEPEPAEPERPAPKSELEPPREEPAGPATAALPEPPGELRRERPAAIHLVGQGDVARGGELLGSGDFPVLSLSYESFPSFAAYARTMQSLGAEFVVVRRRAIVGSVDIASGEAREAALVGRFSPRARDYTGEPGLTAPARSARERFGRGSVVMMLVPHALDAGLFGGIERALRGRGDDPASYREIRGRYLRSAGGLVLHVDEGIRSDGSRVALDLRFDLEGILRGARA